MRSRSFTRRRREISDVGSGTEGATEAAIEAALTRCLVMRWGQLRRMEGEIPSWLTIWIKGRPAAREAGLSG